MDIRHVIARRLGFLMSCTPSLDTQMKLAARTGIGQTTIGRIRRGEVNATADNIKRIADAFGTPVGYLFGEGLPRSGVQFLGEVGDPTLDAEWQQMQREGRA